MGLTIHYSIEYEGTTKQLQKKLKEVRRICLDLPFQNVGERVNTVKITKEIIQIYERLSQKVNYPNNSKENLAMRDSILKELGTSTCQMAELEEGKPTTIVSLDLLPGEGCESMDLCFQRRDGKYVCESFCKTQYAEEFVQCHLLIIKLLDLLKEKGFEVEVVDEGGYWETRDLKVLAKNLNESTSGILAIGGLIRSGAEQLGMTVESAIDDCENYMEVQSEEIKMKKKYKIVNNNDGNDQMELKSSTEEDAYEEALEVAGWTLVVEEVEDE